MPQLIVHVQIAYYRCVGFFFFQVHSDVLNPPFNLHCIFPVFLIDFLLDVVAVTIICKFCFFFHIHLSVT